jgi:hypothetical protein
VTGFTLYRHLISLMLHVTISRGHAMPAPVNQRVRKRREALRAAGLRPVQIWVPDTRRQGFAEECRRQSIVVAAADAADDDLDAFVDGALTDLGEDEA